MKRIFCIICLLLVFGIISGCNQKPSSVRQEIWDQGIQYTIYINKVLEEKGETEEGFNDAFLSFASSYNETELSDTEKEILDNLRNLNLNFLKIHLFQLTGGETEEERNEYDKFYANLEKIYGKSNLSSNNLNEDFITTASVDSVVKETVTKQDEIEEFKKKAGISLTADEVRFNMSNNLDMKFFLEGNIELCDYYNYGFTNDRKFFCGQVTPLDGGYTDSWYLYFNRESFAKLYNKLLDKQISYIRTSAQVPSKVYKDGQGNMAVVNAAEWK